ncbi:MAG: trigger factor [Dehalococcoidia bacterium]|nr:trigger factor [Dehalococcoidia bacterium]
MKLLDRKTENHQEILHVEMESAEVAQALDQAYEHLLKEVKLDGFRPGKAPRELLDAKIGKDAVFDEAMKTALPELIDTLLVEQKIRAYATPRVKVTSQEPVNIEVTVPLMPVIELGDYNAIKMQPNPVSIQEEAVDEIIERARHQMAEWISTGVPAEMDDLLVMDVDSDIEGTPYFIEEGASYQIVAGTRFPLVGFSEALVGAKAGEEREFNLKIPEDYPDKERAGKEAHFKIKVIDVKREELPVLNDFFANKVAPGSKNMQNLRDAVREDMRSRAQSAEDMAFEEKVIDALVEKSHIEYPPLLIENEIDRMVREYVDRVRNSVQNEEEFKSIMDSSPEDKLRESYKPSAEQHVKRNLVISRLVEVEKIEVPEADIDFQIAGITATSGEKVRQQTIYLNKPENRETLRWWLASGQAKKLLVNKAKEGAPEAATEPAAEAKAAEPETVADTEVKTEDQPN